MRRSLTSLTPLQGMNAHFVLRIATDRDWAADVRAQSFWLEETNRIGKCNHYMYRGEAVFFARFDGKKFLVILSYKLTLRGKLEVWVEGPRHLQRADWDQHEVPAGG